LKVLGLTEKSNLNKPILGISDTETVKLDFDNISFSDVKYWALKAKKKFRLDGFLILRSSEKCYHVVFNHAVSWARNLKIVAWVSLLSQNKGLLEWFRMQCIKGSSTLRVSSKRAKPSPRIVFRLGKEDQEIKNYVKNRRLIKQIIKKL
jgi:hypothetical protein